MSTLLDLFPKTRAEILRLLFETGDQEIHLRDLARLASLSPAALQKELTSLASKELVLTRRDGNRLYYRANSFYLSFRNFGASFSTTICLALGWIQNSRTDPLGEFLTNLHATLNAPSHPVRQRLDRIVKDSPDLLAVIKQKGKV